jgi:hypothetical protein
MTMARRTLALGGNKKLGIHVTLQTICLRVSLLRGGINVNRSRAIHGCLLYVQEKPSKHLFVGY